MLSGDCNTCHSGASRFPVSLLSSTGGTGLAAISCVGCHGRAADNVAANPEVGAGRSGYGAGLRQYHQRKGVTACSGCHLDATPAAYTPAGENVLPPYYASPGTGHTAMPTLSCNPAGEEDFAGATYALDNDGDLVRDMLDTDCAVVSPVGTACTTAASCASGFCVDGFCCSTACGAGSTTDCQACSNALTGVANGTCGNVTAAAAVVCRASAGVCDSAEACSGASATCPADALAPATTTCRPAAGACDSAELCTATSAACPADVSSCSATTYCTPGGCVAKNANGAPCAGAGECTSGFCADGVCCNTACDLGCDACAVAAGAAIDGTCGLVAAGRVCRTSGGPCDADETCSGASADCPADVLKPQGATCRAAAGACDVAETCSGTSSQCGANQLAAAGASCRPEAGPCDGAEVCTGTAADCPADQPQADGTTCPDGTCTAGQCVAPDPGVASGAKAGCGCAAGGEAGTLLLVGLTALLRRRRKS